MAPLVSLLWMLASSNYWGNIFFRSWISCCQTSIITKHLKKFYCRLQTIGTGFELPISIRPSITVMNNHVVKLRCVLLSNTSCHTNTDALTQVRLILFGVKFFLNSLKISWPKERFFLMLIKIRYQTKVY